MASLVIVFVCSLAARIIAFYGRGFFFTIFPFLPFFFLCIFLRIVFYAKNSFTNPCCLLVYRTLEQYSDSIGGPQFFNVLWCVAVFKILHLGEKLKSMFPLYVNCFNLCLFKYECFVYFLIFLNSFFLHVGVFFTNI